MTDDDVLARIDQFNRSHGGGVMADASHGGYTLRFAEAGAPIARLRPTGKDNKFNVLYRSHRDTWRPIGDFGGIILPLDDALEYIASQPIFWEGL